MSKMNDSFIAVYNKYLGTGLKSIDILIISKIKEFERNNCKCYVTNEQFSEWFGESVSTIKRALDKLEDMKIITRETITIKGNGRANKQRILSLNNSYKWKAQNEPTKDIMQGSKSDNGRFKNEQCKVHNDPIKDNLKDNKKDNLSIENANAKTDRRTIEDLSLEQLKSLKKEFSQNVSYNELKAKYNLPRLTAEIMDKVDCLISEKEREIEILNREKEIIEKEELEDKIKVQLEHNPVKQELMNLMGVNESGLAKCLSSVGYDKSLEELVEFLKTDDGKTLTHEYWLVKKQDEFYKDWTYNDWFVTAYEGTK